MQKGFQPCDKNGYPVEPAPGWEGFYYCDDCGRIIEAKTLNVVGTAVPPQF
jgi:hypothetical protein